MSAYSDLILGTSGLLVYYRLGESAGPTADDALGSLDGTYVGCTFSQVGGVWDTDTAVLFDGIDDKVTIPSGVSLTADSSITVEFWQKVNTADLQGAAAFTIGDNLTDRCSAHCPWDAGQIFWDYGNDIVEGQGRLSSVYTPYLDKWTYMAFLCNTATDLHAIYANGVLIASHTNADSPTVTLSGGAVGALPSNSNFQKGTMDEFAVYNVALTPAQIFQHYLFGLNTVMTKSFQAIPLM